MSNCLGTAPSAVPGTVWRGSVFKLVPRGSQTLIRSNAPKVNGAQSLLPAAGKTA